MERVEQIRHDGLVAGAVVEAVHEGESGDTEEEAGEGPVDEEGGGGGGGEAEGLAAEGAEAVREEALQLRPEEALPEASGDDKDEREGDWGVLVDHELRGRGVGTQERGVSSGPTSPVCSMQSARWGRPAAGSIAVCGRARACWRNVRQEIGGGSQVSWRCLAKMMSRPLATDSPCSSWLSGATVAPDAGASSSGTWSSSSWKMRPGRDAESSCSGVTELSALVRQRTLPSSHVGCACAGSREPLNQRSQAATIPELVLPQRVGFLSHA